MIAGVALIQEIPTYSKSCRPLFEDQSFTTMCNLNGSSRILHLFTLVCPSAVFVKIVSIWIYSVQSFIFRLWSHFLEKNLKRVPSLTNSDATSTIVSKLSAFWIFATALHGFPRSIGFGSRHSVSCVIMFFSHVISPIYGLVRGQMGVIAPPSLANFSIKGGL